MGADARQESRPAAGHAEREDVFGKGDTVRAGASDAGAGLNGPLTDVSRRDVVRGAGAGRSVLLHACCGPCSLMPIRQLREEGFTVTVLFFNPNIHPQEEYALRLEAMRQAARQLEVPLLVEGEAVDPAAWVAALGAERAEGVRCRHCYRPRMETAARLAVERGFSCFTTSLLYSRYQHHETICEEAGTAARSAGTTFLYRDFRPWWQEGIEVSKSMGLYRQKWCGCILSKGEAEAQRARRQAEKEARKARRGQAEA